MNQKYRMTGDRKAARVTAAIARARPWASAAVELAPRSWLSGKVGTGSSTDLLAGRAIVGTVPLHRRVSAGRGSRSEALLPLRICQDEYDGRSRESSSGGLGVPTQAETAPATIAHELRSSAG